MTKKKPKKGGDFHNHWKEISSTPWRRFPTCSFEELFENRIFCWKLDHKVQAIMRLYYPSGYVKEFVIKHGDDINQIIQSVLNYDPEIQIFIVNPMQQLFLKAVDPDDDAPPPPKSPVSV